MKVLFIANIPSPYRVDFFNELGKKCDLTVLYERKQASDREWSVAKAKNYEEIYLHGINVGADTAFSIDILKYLKKGIYDIVVVGGYSTPTGMLAIEYMMFNNISFIMNSDGGFIKKHNGILDPIKRHFISRASAWLSPSEVTDNYLVHYGADYKKIYRYPFTSLFERDILKTTVPIKNKHKIREKLKIKQKQVIISVGQFIHRKGFDVLLKAGNNINKNVGIYIVGGKATEEYIKIQQKYGLDNIYYIPFMDSAKLKEYYSAADIFVLPTREDIWGLVVNEAMANGLPVITTDKCVAGLELIKNGYNGFVVPADEPVLLSEYINKTLSNIELMNFMSKNSIKIISKYTLENMAQRHIDIFKTEVY